MNITYQTFLIDIPRELNLIITFSQYYFCKCDVVKSFLKSQFTSDSQSLIFLKTIINEITEYQLVELFEDRFQKI